MKKFVVSAIALAIVGLVAAPAMAEFVTAYGSVRMETFYRNVTEPSGSALDDDGDLIWEMEAISRFGAKLKTDDLTGQTEFSLNSGAGTVGLRHLWAQYQTDAGALRMGQTWTQTSLWLTDLAAETENGMIGYGALYDGREPMIRWAMPMGLSIELLEPETGKNVGADNVDTIIPKIGVRYVKKWDTVTLHVAGALQTFKLEDANNDLDDESITSYFVGAFAKGTFGPATIAGTGHYGVNLGNHGIAGGTETAAGEAMLDPVNGKIEDSTQFGGWLTVAMAAGPGTATIGAGYEEVDNDLYRDPDGAAAYFVQYNYPIAKTFFIVPEVAYFDEMDDENGNEQSDRLYVGAKWQMNF
jgi:hypothetical protein